MVIARPRSISIRLFIWLLVSGILALTIGGSLIYFEVRGMLLASLDRHLQSDVEIFTGLLHLENGKLKFETGEMATGLFSIPRSGQYFQVFQDGSSVAASDSLAGEQLDGNGWQLATADQTNDLNTYVGTGPADEPLRIMEQSLEFGGQPARILVAHSLLEERQILGRLRHFLLLSGVIGSLLIALLGWQLSRSSLRPLRHFSRQIDRIREQTLDQRLPEPGQFTEFTPLTRAFNTMLERLQRSLNSRQELLGEVSHQLKTPVTVVRSHCDIYLQKPRQAAEYVEALEVIRDTADSMTRKIQRLLSLARSEAELVKLSGLEQIDLADSLEKAMVSVAPLARDRHIEIISELDSGLDITGRPERLVEAFSNLLENAVKYNHDGGQVWLRARAEKQQILVRVEDTGCGIDPQEIERIFERFYRGRDADRAEGSGLGLVLVRAIVEAHRGQIEVSNRSEGGSCFQIILPRNPPEIKETAI